MKRFINFVSVMGFMAIVACAVCALAFHGSLNFETYLEQDTKYLMNGTVQYIVVFLFLVLVLLLASFLRNISSKKLIRCSMRTWQLRCNNRPYL